MKKPRKSPQKRMKQIIPAKEQRLMDLAEFRSGYAHSNRSGRAAAQESAYRTHKYAITGEWANMPPMFKTVEPSSSDNVSAPLSDSPEEIAYIGPNHGHHYQSSYPPADATARTSDDCFAAINLMTMSAKSSLDDTFFSAHGVGSGSHSAQQQQNLARTDTPESSPTKISGLTPSNLDVEAALAKISQLARGRCGCIRVPSSFRGLCMTSSRSLGSHTRCFPGSTSNMSRRWALAVRGGSRDADRAVHYTALQDQPYHVQFCSTLWRYFMRTRQRYIEGDETETTRRRDAGRRSPRSDAERDHDNHCYSPYFPT